MLILISSTISVQLILDYCVWWHLALDLLLWLESDGSSTVLLHALVEARPCRHGSDSPRILVHRDHVLLHWDYHDRIFPWL